MSDRPPRAQLLSRILPTVGLIVLSFLFGAFVTEMRVFPYTLLEDSFTALRAQIENYRLGSSVDASIRWVPDNTGKKGVVVHDATRVSPGYTLIGEPLGTEAKLIDIEGNTVHSWSLPFVEVWEDPPHIKNPVAPEHIVWSGATVRDNGDLFVHFNTERDTPYGYGFIKIDRDSNLIWSFADRTHHAFDVEPDGSVYLLTHRFRDLEEEPVVGLSWGAGRFLDDDVVQLSPDGEEIWRLSLADAIGNSVYAGMLFARMPSHWDWLHTNAVKVVPASWAAHHDFAEAGHLLVSFRELHALAIIDPESEQVVWATRGFWLAQHDPDFTEGGNLLVFDNLGAGRRSGRSRVVEFDPRTGERVWSYDGTRETPFDSEWGGTQQVLPNGNVLITESAGGRLLEVTRDGDIVWEYFTESLLERDGERYRTAVGAVERHESLSFLKRAR